MKIIEITVDCRIDTLSWYSFARLDKFEIVVKVNWSRFSKSNTYLPIYLLTLLIGHNRLISLDTVVLCQVFPVFVSNVQWKWLKNCTRLFQLYDMEKYKSWGCSVFADESKLASRINLLDLMDFPALLHCSRDHLRTFYLDCGSPFRPTCSLSGISSFLNIQHAWYSALKLIIDHIRSQVCKAHSLAICYDHVNVTLYTILVSLLPNSTNKLIWTRQCVRIIFRIFDYLYLDLLDVILVFYLYDSICMVLIFALKFLRRTFYRRFIFLENEVIVYEVSIG